MKHLMLISILCLFASCGENSKKLRSQSSMGQPYVSVLEGEVIVPVIMETEEMVTVIEETEDTTPVIEESEDTTPEVADTEETAPEVEVINEESNALVCDFSNDNQQSSFSLLIKNKLVVMKDLENEGKLTFDRHIFSPSGNQNAAVQHEDENFSVEEGKVIKITARIVMSEDLKSGELQVSYKVKTGNKKTIQIDFKKLADIKNCK